MSEARPRVALVTGASRGIGRAIAIELARSNHCIGVNYVARESDAQATLDAIEAAGSKGVCVQGDVSDPVAVSRCFDEIEAAFGPVEVLVNNAGRRDDSLALSMSDEAWSSVIATNLSGTFFCSRRALRSMLRARWGRIVNVASVAGLRASPGQANYAAAKAGVIALTKTMAREVASRNITVNALAPGLIETEMTSGLRPEQTETLLASIPARRAGIAEDVSCAVAWLCSDEASYMTGSVITTDGGMST